jgi:hypothetical protein
VPHQSTRCLTATRVSSAALVSASLIALAAAGQAAYHLAVPPFTDQEIAWSWVDVWDPFAIFTAVVLAVVVLAAVVSGLLAFLGPRRVRAFAVASVLVCLASVSLVAYQHSRFAAHVSSVSGHPINPLWHFK